MYNNQCFWRLVVEFFAVCVYMLLQFVLLVLISERQLIICCLSADHSETCLMVDSCYWSTCHLHALQILLLLLLLCFPPLPPIDTVWAMMIIWRTRGDYRTARAVLEAIIAFSAMHTYYEQLLQVKQICLCLTGFTSLCLDAYVFLCSLVFHCMHVVLL